MLLQSRNLVDICLDGEILSGHTFDIEVLPQSIQLILPSLVSMKKRFEPIIDKCGEIIDYLMSSPDIPQDEALQFKIRLSDGMTIMARSNREDLAEDSDIWVMAKPRHIHFFGADGKRLGHGGPQALLDKLGGMNE